MVRNNAALPSVCHAFDRRRLKEIKPCRAVPQKSLDVSGFDSRRMDKTSKTMRVYIAGKVTGLPTGEVFTKFGQAEYWLKGQGHDVVNPLRLCSSEWSWNKCMRVCLGELLKCDAVCLLKDWCDSPGAHIEYYIASVLKMRVMYYRS